MRASGTICSHYVDCVVIGTGLYGLGAAKQFRHFNPQSSLVVFERESSIGGTWADQRLYPGITANNLLGTYEYPDFPMHPEVFGVKKNEHIPGAVLNAYHKAYAAKFGITPLVRFNTKVQVAEHMETEDGGWELTTLNSKTNVEAKIFTRRLIVATGQTSEPFLPHFDGEETFGGPIFHVKDWPLYTDTIKKETTITVFGGRKFNWDAVYQYASAGAKVNWVIRFTDSIRPWPCLDDVSMGDTIEEMDRAACHPCIWGQYDGYIKTRSFFHGTAIGRAIVRGFWSFLGRDVIASNKYDSHPDTAKLKPWTDAMFTGASFSFLNYKTDIFELIKSDLVTVYIGEIDHLSPGAVHLADGTKLESNVLLCHTGWKQIPPLKFLPEGIEGELGIPHPPHQYGDDVGLGSDERLLQRADEEILRRFPILKDPPNWNPNYVPLTELKGISSDDADAPSKPQTSYMLYHFIIPSSERFLRTRDIAFSGAMSNYSNPITSHLSGLWISAYFSGKLTNDPSAAVGDEESLAKLQYETVLHNRFGKWRCPTDWGSTRPPSLIFDGVPYFDLLLHDLGLQRHRKGGWWSEMWSPYDPRDYKTVNEEWEKLNKTTG
ncbi:LOW QUALITY PROTEIN: FAD/NAD(P)-binding domain-containing protein [Paramyrothecium foliicola]|nr:LOW QUALITY PROTEIN: FAD/NAD(P)-binding domain-containing protein [Paramyrothecium foliicola]